MRRWENPLIEAVGLRDLLKEDFRQHHRDWTRPGFRALAVYRFGTWARSRGSKPVRMALSLLHLLLFRHVRNHYGIEISYKCRIGRRFEIGHQHGIVIHEYATIGDDCVIRQGATLGLGGISRGTPVEDTGPIIGDRVDIGAGVMIIGKVTIGSDVNIGPNAVILSDVPSNTTVLAPFPKILPRRTPPSASDTTAQAE
jgi:serine O-acetyltransferase